MNEKLNIQDLIEMLAEKHGMNRKDAENFVKEFFQLVEESLEKDKYVKIRGLGTFKLIDVESRESVNVNTGERFEIQGHTKVSFTPEPSLKDIINKPFSHFETVVLNDNTVLDDTPVDNDNAEYENIDSKNPEAEVKEQAVKNVDESDVAPEKMLASEQEDIQETEEESLKIKADEPESSEEISFEVMDAPIEGAVVSETVESAGVSDVLTVAEKMEKTVIEEPLETPGAIIGKDDTDTSSMKYFIGIVVFVAVLCGGAVAFMYYPDMLDRLAGKTSVEEAAEAETKQPLEKDVAALADSLLVKEIIEPSKSDTVAEALAVVPKSEPAPAQNMLQPAPTKKEQKKSSATPFEPDSVGYIIDGTETTYTIKEGETLTKVALRFYGTKALWPYLVKHNPGIIKNPDNVPYGTTIKIPKLVKKQ